ncbi:MAG: hypothetical protein ACFE89_06070 [Candidatus Hodarchaeota archaeon]
MLLFAGLVPLTAAHTEDDPLVVDLIAGGGNAKSAIDVGDVSIWNDLNYLYVKYEVVDPWCITETHLHIATSPDLIPQRRGNPIPGHFMYNDEWDPCITEHTYMISLTWPSYSDLFIAAHAVVQRLIGYEPPSLDEFSDVLPDTVTMSVQYPYAGGPAYFPVTTVEGDPLTGSYEGWCADTDHVINQNTWYTANVFSSYEELPLSLIEYPENLDLVNWILNQAYVGQPSPFSSGIYTYGDVQRAIWALIEDGQSTAGLDAWSQTRVDEILTDAQANGEDFEPGCGDSIAVILAPVTGEQVLVAQVTFIDVGLECTPIYQTETAWGDGLDFLGKNWATYIPYTVQPIIITFPEEGNAYIGYEDRTGGDFDYNDFGMNMYVQETYANGYLESIQLEFTSVVHKAGDNHDIHIARSFAGTTEYTYTITRDHTAYGTETPACTDTPGTGPFDVILFDSSDPNVVGKTVTIDITITTESELYDPSPTPPRWDLAPVFAYYDPWMYDKSYGPTDWHLDDWQTTTTSGPLTPGIDVPYIIIVPYTDWPAPDEGIPITTPYPDFDDYYLTTDPIYADWYQPP